jgi:hypothetical protein
MTSGTQKLRNMEKNSSGFSFLLRLLFFAFKLILVYKILLNHCSMTVVAAVATKINNWSWFNQKKKIAKISIKNRYSVFIIPRSLSRSSMCKFVGGRVSLFVIVQKDIYGCSIEKKNPLGAQLTRRLSSMTGSNSMFTKKVDFNWTMW